MVSAVVLAAGTSTRMGTQKLLLPLGGEPLISRVVKAVCESGFDDVLVVVGHEHEKVLEALAEPADPPCIQSGLRDRHGQFVPDGGREPHTRARPPCSRWPISRLSLPAEYRKVLEAYRQHQSPIVSVRYGEVMAPPHLFAREFFPELAVLEHGARPVLLRHRDRTMILTFAPDLLADVDTPEDYEEVNRRLSSGA